MRDEFYLYRKNFPFFAWIDNLPVMLLLDNHLTTSAQHLNYHIRNCIYSIRPMSRNLNHCRRFLRRFTATRQCLLNQTLSTKLLHMVKECAITISRRSKIRCHHLADFILGRVPIDRKRIWIASRRKIKSIGLRHDFRFNFDEHSKIPKVSKSYTQKSITGLEQACTRHMRWAHDVLWLKLLCV